MFQTFYEIFFFLNTFIYYQSNIFYLESVCELTSCCATWVRQKATEERKVTLAHKKNLFVIGVSRSAYGMRRLISWSSCCRVKPSVLPHSWLPACKKSLLSPTTASGFRTECLVSQKKHFFFLRFWGKRCFFFQDFPDNATKNTQSHHFIVTPRNIDIHLDILLLVLWVTYSIVSFIMSV